jgi:hypothetical protein
MVFFDVYQWLEIFLLRKFRSLPLWIQLLIQVITLKLYRLNASDNFKPQL